MINLIITNMINPMKPGEIDMFFAPRSRGKRAAAPAGPDGHLSCLGERIYQKRAVGGTAGRKKVGKPLKLLGY